ncbi:hypothetical protein A33Q_2778 [Indibacter alkaliphilus LW1]|uniref:Uncharacterized protein n=1 Tax=Indibacter alkaliphilus (strain CCUG 57479 / KCTC 22604 / LW1) TaxID=1189612 RepID=S2DTJ3_INDAL|nr:hypothetical protein A33Q_2778 [Indibacter alkaliphilus LW1]
MELGQSYPIFNHANGMENIFREEENYRFFFQLFQSSKTLDKLSFKLLVQKLNVWS